MLWIYSCFPSPEFIMPPESGCTSFFKSGKCFTITFKNIASCIFFPFGMHIRCSIWRFSVHATVKTFTPLKGCLFFNAAYFISEYFLQKKDFSANQVSHSTRKWRCNSALNLTTNLGRFPNSSAIGFRTELHLHIRLQWGMKHPPPNRLKPESQTCCFACALCLSKCAPIRPVFQIRA